MDTTFSFSDNSAMKRFYNENGFVVVRDLISPTDLADLRNAFDEAVAKGDLVLDDEVMIESNDAIYRHPLFEKFAREGRIALEAVPRLPDPDLSRTRHELRGARLARDEAERASRLAAYE